MTRIKSMPVSLLAAALGLSIVAPGLAGEGYTTSVYAGQIKSARSDHCGLQLRLSAGSILLARKGVEKSLWTSVCAPGFNAATMS